MGKKMTKFGLFLWGIIVLINPGLTNIVARGANHKIHKRCAPEARECCKYKVLSKEFWHCCEAYQCCPVCDDVLPSKDCCYNDKFYSVGSVVAQFPEVCLELVCQLIKTEPPTSVITHREMTPCKDPCGTSDECHCKDQYLDGLLHLCGTSWMDMKDPCVKHECGKDGVIYSMKTACPEPPCDADPVYMQGECCPKYFCYTTEPIPTTPACDSNGDTWTDPDNPCIFHSCENGVIVTSYLLCLTAPCPPKEGECCPSHDCTTTSSTPETTTEECLCEDKSGQHLCGSSWEDPDDPCIFYRCNEGKILTSIRDCARPPCNVAPTFVDSYCCPIYNCFTTEPISTTPGCDSNGNAWIDADDPCIYHYCENGVLETSHVLCLTAPCPPKDGECCPSHDCTTTSSTPETTTEECLCEDKSGQHLCGSSWDDPNNPCKFYRCNEGKILTSIMDCARPPCNVEPTFVDGQCCPTYNCSPNDPILA